MSKVWARRLMAGTVKPDTSPRARASYSPWMLAARAPSAWARLPDEPLGGGGRGLVGAERRGPREVLAIAAPRNAASSSMTRRSSSRWALPERTVSRSTGEVATVGIEAHLQSRWDPMSWYRRDQS